jgi:hypothetical protein
MHALNHKISLITNHKIPQNGFKKGQQKNIDKAKKYWCEYLSSKRGKK